MRPVLSFSTSTPVYQASRTTRETRNQIALVHDSGADPMGPVTDAPRRLLPMEPAWRGAS